jgi:hypothetical protein
MPVTGFQNNGQPVTPPGFDKEYGLYLTVDASGTVGTNGAANPYTSLNVTLWADPKLLHGSIAPGSQLEEQLTTPPVPSRPSPSRMEALSIW